MLLVGKSFGLQLFDKFHVCTATLHCLLCTLLTLLKLLTMLTLFTQLWSKTAVRPTHTIWLLDFWAFN